MAEHEPATAGRQTALSHDVVGQTFKGDVRGSLDDSEANVRRYEGTCGEFLSDRVKIAVVQSGVEDEDLVHHFSHARYTSFVLHPRA